jgi:hypothetical protein
MVEVWRLQLRLISRINLSFLLSAREFWSEITAQIAAGIQPIRVIWRMRQRIPVSIRPRSRKETKGRKMAIRVMGKLLRLIVSLVKVGFTTPRVAPFKRRINRSPRPGTASGSESLL